MATSRLTLLKQANIWAQKSCSRWNKNGLSRLYYRRKYRKLAEAYYDSNEYRLNLLATKRGYDKRKNTYPWPYCDEKFANWEESEDENYSLITDQSGCVIRHSTSYCAYKIFEATGEWPQKTSKRRLDAKLWMQFLFEAGYTYILPQNERLDSYHCYVGINSDETEWGLVVWSDLGEDSDGNAIVSSYVNKQYKLWTVNALDYVWIFIK